MAFPVSVWYGAAIAVGVNGLSNSMNDQPFFKNALTSAIVGGASGGIFGGAEGAIPFGESTFAGNMDSIFGSGAPATAGNAVGSAANATMAGPSTMGANPVANTGNLASDLVLNNTYTSVGSLTPAQTFGFVDPWAGAPPGVSLPPPDIPASVDASLSVAPSAPVDSPRGDPNYSLTNKGSSVGFREAGGRLAGTDATHNWLTNPGQAGKYLENYWNPHVDAGATPVKFNAMSPNSRAATPSTASPKFWDKPWEYLTHKDNRGTVAMGGLGIAGATGMFSPKQNGLAGLPPRQYTTQSATYNAPQFTTDQYGRVTYVPGSQGYGPMTSSTRTVAAGGGIRALNKGGGTAPYVPLETRRGERPIKLYSPEDSEAFKNYEKTDINAEEEKEQAKIDKNVLAWLERHGKADIKGLAAGGLTTPQAAPMLNMYSQPSVYGTPPQSFNPMQGGGFNSNAPSYDPAQVSPLFQQTGGSAQSGIQDYVNSINSYVPPPQAPAASYPATPSYVAPVAPVAPVDPVIAVQDNWEHGSPGHENQEKEGGPIKAKRFAMGGLAALPEYAAGGQLLSGAGDGMSDSIPAVIKGERPQRAALADGEFVIPADVVSHLGNGSTKAGGKRLYEMMERVRKVRTGNPKQGKQINPMKFIPA